MNPTIDVMICTCKRPDLLYSTLLSISKQSYPLYLIRVIVVDNDPAESAREIVLSFLERSNSALTIEYFTEPEKNISKARNKAMSQTTAEFVAFIDDDESACENWLASMLQLMHSDNTITAVMGPVVPVYEVDEPKWLIDAGLFERKRFPTGTEVPLLELRTGNVLLKMELVRKHHLCFDEALGLSGGEDSSFFKKLKQLSAKYIWCDDAVVTELVPKERISAKWLLRRSFRIGSVESTLSMKGNDLKNKLYVLLKIVYLLFVGIVGSLFSFSQQKRFVFFRRISISLGLTYGLVFGPYDEYK